MLSNQSNSAKSNNGNALNQKVKQKLQQLVANQIITQFISEPKYNYPSKSVKQFTPDGEITLLNNEIIVFDNTTTIRHDRLKGKLWDAYGIKEHFKAKGKEIRYYVVIPDQMNSKETKIALNQKNKLNSLGYHSSIDDIIKVTELIKML